MIDDTIRGFLIDEVRAFVLNARGLPGIHRISLVGSLATPKKNPKDADLLLEVDDDLELAALAIVARRLKGRAQGRNLGADIFIVDRNEVYQGRICHYRDCRPGIRMSCRAIHCGRRPHLCDDLHVLNLPAAVVKTPPVELWPQPAAHVRVPADIHGLVYGIKLTIADLSVDD